MFKKLLSVLIMTMVVFGLLSGVQAIAGDDPIVDISAFLDNIPETNQGAIYSITDSQIKYVATAKLIEIERCKGLNIEYGYAAVDDEALLAATYEVAKLADYTSIPVLDLIEFNVGLYAGCTNISTIFNNDSDNEDTEWDGGASLTLINLKW